MGCPALSREEVQGWGPLRGTSPSKARRGSPGEETLCGCRMADHSLEEVQIGKRGKTMNM